MAKMHYLKQIVQLFYPRICACCPENLVHNENYVCLTCRSDLAITQFSSESGNIIELLFYGKIKIEFATALLYYRTRGRTQQLIYRLKYKGDQALGVFFGQWIGDQLKSENRCSQVDLILPVPLHKRKLRKRGYNQLTRFGKTLASILDAEYLDKILKRGSTSQSQTLKDRFERFKNVSKNFFITNKEPLIGKHILLIDDVITTGATLEACALLLKDIEGIKISIACMAYTE